MLFMRREARRCYWCGCHLAKKRKGRATPRTSTVDHLTPTSRGGGRGDNEVSCCFACNNRKGDMTAAEYIAFLRNR